MANVNHILNQRLKVKEKPSSKMSEMAQKSANGQLTSFNGLFGVSDLNEKEKEHLEEILKSHHISGANLKEDLKYLISLTSEVKAINNQAAILHGERIKKAQLILTKYKDGAFTNWMLATYGNRQTPYNLLQYYEFCQALPTNLREKVEEMPRQAIYTLASRNIPIEKKRLFVEDYQGENKIELLNKIREHFPLAKTDQRASLTHPLIKQFQKISIHLKTNKPKFNKEQKKALKNLVEEFCELIGL